MSDFTNGAHECFCDRQYKDANKLASCGDCPRDYIAGAWDARRKYIEEHSKMTDRQRIHDGIMNWIRMSDRTDLCTFALQIYMSDLARKEDEA